MRYSFTAIQRTPQVLGGAPVFHGTRVPVKTLLDYLEAGERIEDFLDDFPTVSSTQVRQFLEEMKASILEQNDETAA